MAVLKGWTAAAVLALSGYGAGPAQADFDVCNDSSQLINVAIGYKEDGDWVSQGWWVIDPGECATAIGGQLKNAHYYLYSESRDGEWVVDGDYIFCTQDRKFRIEGDTNCRGRGYQATGFDEVYVGDAIDYTVNID